MAVKTKSSGTNELLSDYSWCLNFNESQTLPVWPFFLKFCIFLLQMPQTVPSVNTLADYAFESFDLSLLPNAFCPKEEPIDIIKEEQWVCDFYDTKPIKTELWEYEEKVDWSCDYEDIKDHRLLREALEDTSFQRKHNFVPVSLGELGVGYRTEMEQVDLPGIEPALSMAMEQFKKEVHSTCAVLGISSGN